MRASTKAPLLKHDNPLDPAAIDAITAWLPNVLYATHPRAAQATLDFIESHSNANTRAAYLRILQEFLLCVERNEFQTLADLTTTHISHYLRSLLPTRTTKPLSTRSRAQVLACLRGYFNQLIRNGVITTSPAAAVKSYSVKAQRGHYHALSPAEVTTLLDGIPTATLADLRDRAIIAMMIYSCARVSAVVSMHLTDITQRAGHLQLFLEEKRNKRHYLPCHPELEMHLRAYLNRAAVPATDCHPNPQGWVFRNWDKKNRRLTAQPLTRLACYRMVKRRAKSAGLDNVTNHTFRATGITTYLNAGAELDDARRLANHASVNTTKLYDDRDQAVTLDDILKIDYRKK